MSDRQNVTNDANIGFVDVYMIFSTLWRRKFTIAAFGILVGAAAAFYTFSLPNQYVAGSRLIIQPEQTRLAGIAFSNNVRPISEALIESNAYMVLSNGNLAQVVRDLELEQNEVFLGKTDDSKPVLDLPDIGLRLAMKKLNEVLTVRPVGKSFIVSIEARTESPILSADIANAVARTFIASEQRINSTERKAANEWLNDQLEDLRARVNESSGELETFRSQVGDLSERKINDITRILEALRGDAVRSQNKPTGAVHNRLVKRITAQEEELRRLTSKRIDLIELERQAEADSALYERLLERARELRQLESFQVANIRIVSDALPPLQKSAPRRKLIVILGVILGCAFGAGFVALRGISAPKY